MPLSLQPPVSTYFEASNEHDADAVAALFVEGPGAWVHDERQDHGGR